MTTLRLVLGDQLSHSLSSLQGASPQDTILMCEVMQEATYVAHHPKKIAFLFSAMRHFAEELKAKGCQVRYIPLDDPSNPQSFEGEVKRALSQSAFTKLIVTEPGEIRLLDSFKNWEKTFGLPVEIRPDTRFLCTISEFTTWVGDKKQLRMEYFYRSLRVKYGILLDKAGKPEGGQWNYDKENRKPPRAGLTSPPRLSHPKDAITQAVLTLVKEKFSQHFGTLEPFHYAVTRAQALEELNHFITTLLPFFGDFQDAMVTGQPYLYHSLLSSYLNAGLLEPLEICEAAELAYRQGKAPLNATEGFIRQILGWREYVRGIYWHYMPAYGNMNYFEATRPLPEFYWTAQTKMFCMAQAISHTRDHAYSHHIQRLMITGNFALLAGLDVKEVQAWYLAVYSDAYEWVEMPNTLGMALFGDGGIMASKPYAASGKYIHKMSNYCQNCVYNPQETTTEDACPFNALYWHFMSKNQDKLKKNHRLPFVYATWDKFGPEKQKAIGIKAESLLQSLKEKG